MRTTLDIEDDVLLAAKELARQRGLSTGKVLSDLARTALTRGTANGTLHGVPLFPVKEGAQIVTPELVNQLRDDPP